jgi:hypothetical protein
MYICKVINNEKTEIMKANFEIYPIGTKVQSYDKDGYYVMSACGIIVEHLGDGDVIIKTFDGDYRSTVGQFRVFEIESLV